MKRVIRGIATLGFVGYFPLAPATAGSAFVTAVAYFVPVPPLPVALGIILVATFVAVWICGEAEKELGHDARPIVADEAVGQSVALIGAHHDIITFAAAFVVFRVLDIWKPVGARQSQKLPGGWGVVTDDIIAGLVACLILNAAWSLIARFLQ